LTLRAAPAAPEAGRRNSDDDIEAAKAMLGNPDIGVTKSRTASASHPRPSIATFPQREPRIPPALEERALPAKLASDRLINGGTR
jgi:hypothetical protein